MGAHLPLVGLPRKKFKHPVDTRLNVVCNVLQAGHPGTEGKTMADKVDVLAVLDSQTLTAHSNIVRSLELIGWQLLSVEIDTCAETARIELRRGELYVVFDARNGRASITREVMGKELVRVGRKGDVTVVERARPRFLGRQGLLGLRSGLRTLSNYVADNSPLAISREDARDIFRPLLASSALARIGGAA